MDEYPKMLYSADVEAIVADAVEEEAMRAKGFGDYGASLTKVVGEAKVDGVAGEAKLLDGNAVSIVAALPDLSDDELLELAEEEKAGKARKGVIAAIEEEISKR